MDDENQFSATLESCDSSYELESAISTTAEAAKGQEGVTAEILNDHLKSLCSLQYARLTGFTTG